MSDYGFSDNCHGKVYSIMMNAGVGFSPYKARELSDLATPWGTIIEKIEIDSGVCVVETHSHGGIMLSEARRDQIPPHLSLGSLFYEEDCEVNLIYLAFRDIFPDEIAHALGSYNISIIESSSIPCLRELDEKHEKMLSNILSCTLDFTKSGDFVTKNSYTPPDEDPLNRELTSQERETINYLAQCVFFNKKPLKLSNQSLPLKLSEWVDIYHSTPKVDGKAVFSNLVWKEHFWNCHTGLL